MENNNPILKLKNVSKFYYNGGIVASGFNKISLEFYTGQFVAITGESGSGKSTLLNVLAGLDTYEEGELYINGKETSHYNESDFEEYRKTYISNIFQTFNLVNSYTVYQNIELVLLLNGYKTKNIKNKVNDLIKKVDLYKYRHTKVSHLSGGQKQRVAIARALAKDTPIVVADEPTGNLDVKSAKSIIKLLSEISKDKLVIIVTHNYEQIEDYATRKIVMHDGKVREDIILKETKHINPHITNYSNLTFFNKIRIGIRNTFNIMPKFILTFIVFLFIVLAFLSQYSSFRKLEYEESKFGYNNYFQNTDDTRIIIKKTNGTYFTDDDFNKLNNFNNIERIIKDDVLLDSVYDLTNNNYYFYGNIDNINNLSKVDIGRLPNNEYEVVIKTNEYNYYITNPDELYNQEFTFTSMYDQEINLDKPLKVVGIIINEDTFSFNDTIYVNDTIINKTRLYNNQQYSNIKININNQDYNVNNYDIYLNIYPSKNIKDNEALVSNDINYLCLYNYCLNKKINIEISNIYYTENKELTITNLYNKYNFTNLTGLKNYDRYNGYIFISENDYNDLYNKYTYQASVFVNNVNNLYEVENNLNKEGYTTLVIKDTLVNELSEMLKVIKIYKLVVTIFLLIALFFISYFVIKLIQKSKNIYYATIRILGANKRIIKNLISIELLTTFNIAYLFTIGLILLVKFNIIKTGFLVEYNEYLILNDFIIIYIILLIMSYILSLRYSRKLFKSSAMKAYRKED